MNKKMHSVPQFGEGGGKTRDRRVRRTTQSLTHALIALVQEKRYDAITIQDLLDRADVGRSTFYAHYRGKDDLLFRSFEGMLDWLDGVIESDRGGYPRLSPVRELFRHVGEFRRFHQRLARARMLDRLYQVGTDLLGRRIAARLGASRSPADPAPAPPEIMGQAYAAALFGLLRWWLDHGGRYTPEEMDEIYHRMLTARQPG